MISVHYYDPWDFAGEENGTITQWGPAATNPAKKSTWGQQDFMDAQLKKMHDTFVVDADTRCSSVSTARSTRRRLDSTNNRYRADYARTLVATAKKYGAATAYWDNGYNGQYGFGLFNRSSATVTQQGIIDAIMSGVGSTTPTTPPTTAPPTTTPPPTTPPTTTPPPSSGRSCSASYAVTGQWQGGFQAEVRVTAGGSAISGWTVTWTFANGQQVTQSWGATVTASGSTVTARNVDYNGSLSAGGSTTFGFLGSSGSTNGVPSLSCAAR